MPMIYENDYQVLKIDLSAAKRRERIVDDGILIAAVTVIELPVVAVGKVELHFGPSGDGIPLRQEAVPWYRTPARGDGLFLTVAAGLGAVTLILLVGNDIRQDN